MRNTIKAVSVEVILTKSSAITVATNVFEINTRTNTVIITAPNAFVTVNYKGARNDRDVIKAGCVIESITKREMEA